MHASARRCHSAGQASATETKGLVLHGGWRYDLMAWFHSSVSLGGQWRDLRRRTISLAGLRPGDQVLDVGCGTGTLALDAARHVSSAGRVAGIDPGAEQIARACAKAARRHLPVEFRVGVIEQLPFADQTFDVVFSTLMGTVQSKAG
jgi:ubiquinone/menaquinone biosynthesis C-methylase UbiE